MFGPGIMYGTVGQVPVAGGRCQNEEAAMIRTPRGLLPFALPLFIALLLLLVPACASQLRMVDDKPASYLRALRADYLAANPTGEFNEYVKRGEVVRGMDLVAVLASWGHPARRVRNTDLSELWVYEDVDKDSKDRTEYHFFFHNAHLSDWEINRHVALGRTVVTDPARPKVLTRRRHTSGKRVPGDF